MAWWNDGSSLANSLIDYWKLDEASGDGVAAIGSDTLLAVNAPGNDTGLIYPTARSFNGTSQRFRVVDNASVSVGNIDFFVGAWCYRTASAAVYNVASQYNNSTNQRAWRIVYDNATGRYQFWVSPDGITPTTLTANHPTLGSQLNAWDFVLAWHDATANTINISVNAYAPDSVAYSASGVLNSTEEFMVGAQGTTSAGNPSNWWPGRIGPVFFGKNYIPTAEDRYKMWYEARYTYKEFRTASDVWVPPAGVTQADIYVWGAGAGGSGGNSSDTASGGGGGGGGAHSNRVGAAVTPATSYTTTVGAAGSTNLAGGDSTITTDGSIVTSAKGGGTNGGSQVAGAGGASASGNGTVKTSGGSGGNGASIGSPRCGGGGGGAGGITGNGGTGGTGGTSAGGGGTAGTGGASPSGTGAGAGGGGGANSIAGSGGAVYGGGGGGAGGNNNTGGTGGAGAIVIQWVYPVVAGGQSTERGVGRGVLRGV